MLAYLHLSTYNFVKVIYHARLLLDLSSKYDIPDLKLADQTKYNIHMYMAEALCMMGRFTEALGQIELAEGVASSQEGSKLITTVEQGLRRI
jgi:hypothetical protein